MIHCSVVIHDIMRARALLWFQSIKGHISSHVYRRYCHFLKEYKIVASALFICISTQKF